MPVRPTWPGVLSWYPTSLGQLHWVFFFCSPCSSNHRAFVHAVHTGGTLTSLSFPPTQALLTASSSVVGQWKVLGEDGWAGGEVRYFSPLLPSLHLGRELHPPQLSSHPMSPLISSP